MSWWRSHLRWYVVLAVVGWVAGAAALMRFDWLVERVARGAAPPTVLASPEVWLVLRAGQVFPGLLVIWTAWVCPYLLSGDDVAAWTRGRKPPHGFHFAGPVWLPAILTAFLVFEGPLLGPLSGICAAEAWKWEPDELRMSVIGALVLPPVVAVSIWLTRRVRRRSAETWARTRQQCRRCGYDLRVKPAGPCPECGWRPAATSETKAAPSAEKPADEARG